MVAGIILTGEIDAVLTDEAHNAPSDLRQQLPDFDVGWRSRRTNEPL